MWARLLFANGRFLYLVNSLILSRILYLSSMSWGSNLRYLLELLHLVYLYEYSDYLTEGLSSRFIVQLVIATCILSTLHCMNEPCKSHCAWPYKLPPFISIKSEKCKYFMGINVIKQCMAVQANIISLILETSYSWTRERITWHTNIYNNSVQL